MFRIGPFTLTEAEVARRKAYLGITPADEQRLREAHPHVQRHTNEIIDRFYTYLLSHEHTRAMLSAPGLVERLKGLQVRYFDELTRGVYNLAYFENRLKVGQVHDRVGLSPEWYLGAYNQYLQIATDVLSRSFGRDYERFFQSMTSLTKVVYLDMSLAIDAYIFSAQERLQAKQVALEDSNEELRRLQSAKQQLTDMIVHDLQNPLAGIMAFLEMMEARHPEFGAGEREALAEALRRCHDLSNMIMNVLQVSRADAGRLEAYIENVDLAAVAKETAAGFRLIAERDGRAVGVEAPASRIVRTDQSLLRRMLQNLVRNSLRHTPIGTKVLLRIAEEGGRARISVIDDGPGIPAALQPHLFERFGAAALRQAGLRVDTGLGLPFCKAAADVMGAELGVVSDGKRGTAFVVSFP